MTKVLKNNMMQFLIEKAFYKIILKNFVKGNSSGYSKVELLSAFKRDINWIDADDFYDD